jgi:hypothetical protein
MPSLFEIRPVRSQRNIDISGVLDHWRFGNLDAGGHMLPATRSSYKGRPPFGNFRGLIDLRLLPYLGDSVPLSPGFVALGE